MILLKKLSGVFLILTLLLSGIPPLNAMSRSTKIDSTCTVQVPCRNFDTMLSDLGKAKIEHQQYKNLQTSYHTASTDRDLAKEYAEKQRLEAEKYKGKSRRRGWNTVYLIAALVIETTIIILKAVK